MDLELTGKVAIVGGASKGLGRACAQVLAEEGAKLTICSRTKEDLEKAAAEIHETTGAEVFVFAGDLDQNETIKDLVSATVEKYGQLDRRCSPGFRPARLRRPGSWRRPPLPCGWRRIGPGYR